MTSESGPVPFASEEEIREGLQDLTPVEKRRLAKAARFLIARYPVLATRMQPGDLQGMAFEKLLDGSRPWPKQSLALVPFLVGSMKSIAYNEARKALNTEPQLVLESDLINPDSPDNTAGHLDSVASPDPNPEELMLHAEEEAFRKAIITLVTAKIGSDQEAVQILKLQLDGYSKADIRKMLSMSDDTFWSKDRKIVRAFESILERRKSNDC